MLRNLTICLLLCCLALPLPAPAASWTDALGRRLELPARPQRIVSLVPSLTEILFALGLDQRIVGVTSFCSYPEQALGKPQVGDYANPSLEAVVLQQPDLVFAAADAASPALLAQMERLGLPVYVVYPRGLEETLAMIRAIGEVTGRSKEGEQLARRLADTLAGVRAAVAGRRRPRVLFCIMLRPLTLAGPDTLVGDLIAAAGGDNLVPAGANRYPTWGAEALLLADPELILVAPHPGSPDPVELFSLWPELRAVKNRQIFSITPDWVLRPGPRLALGLRVLAERIQGLDLSSSVRLEQP
jgi:iron complex transport system substrate-binding protein